MKAILDAVKAMFKRLVDKLLGKVADAEKKVVDKIDSVK